MPKMNDIEQMSLDEYLFSSNYETKDNLSGKYAMANDFLRLPKEMDVQSLKVLGLILSKLDFKSDNRNEFGVVEVRCTLNEIVKSCNGTTNNYTYYRDVIKNLIKSSYVEGTIDGVDIMGYTIPRVKGYENTTFEFTIFSDFLPYFQLLHERYTIIELEYTKQFKSRFSYILYMNLLSWCDSKDTEYYHFYTTKQLKDMFGLEKTDYVDKYGKFKRTLFEKYTIIKAVEEIHQHTTMRIEFKKNYNGSKVANYQFNFLVSGDD